tara:strand:+ start:1459 stop:2415 length:957 start_codon:yes stop_codon:yes gene_type:complete
MFFLELILGLVLVLWGADLLISSAIALGKKYNLSEVFIGIIVIGFGTSLCELFVSIDAVIKGASELSLGNIIGSNVANILLVLGVSSFFKVYKFPKINKLDNIIHLTITIFFVGVCFFSYLTKFWGTIFIVIFLIYLSFLLKSINPQESEDNEVIEKKNWLNEKISKSPVTVGIPVIFLSFLITLQGADITVFSAIKISEFFGISESAIGLSVIAIGTSLPEIAAGYAAIKRNKPNLVVGNIIGSNMYNILLIIGISTFFNAFKYDLTNISNDLLFLLFCITVFFVMAFYRVTITKPISIALISVYVSYMIFLYNNNF